MHLNNKVECIVWNLIEKILKVILLDLLHLTFLEKRWDSFIQFIKFGIVGISNTVISYVVYLVAVKCGAYYLLASVLGFVISVINAFYWNNKYVFEKKENETRSILKSFCKTFVAYAGTGLILNNILLIIQVDFLKWSKVIAPLINLLITIPLNFILNKLWAFRENKS